MSTTELPPSHTQTILQYLQRATESAGLKSDFVISYEIEVVVGVVIGGSTERRIPTGAVLILMRDGRKWRLKQDACGNWSRDELQPW